VFNCTNPGSDVEKHKNLKEVVFMHLFLYLCRRTNQRTAASAGAAKPR